MNRESKLHGNAIYSDCENLIKALDAEILNFNNKIDALKDFTDNDSEGNSVKAMNAKCLELSSIIEKMIEADRKEIRDLIILKNKVQDVYIDGADVLDKMKEAERGARECFDKATSLEHAADLAEFTWEADYLRGLASASRSYGESWMRLYTFWEGQAELYDEIDEETSSLFSEGREYHRQADAMIETFLQCRLTSPGFTVSKSRKISKSRRTSINGVSEEEIYKYDHDYLLRNGFSEEQIEYLYRTKPELFSSLYITAQRASDSCPAIIQNMREELNKVAVKYQFLVDDIKKRWNLSDEEATIVLFKLEKHHRLESFYGTYYHSQTEYYTLLDNLAKRCDSWANDHLNELNKTSFAINWNEEEKEKTLSIYYWKYVFCADENIENGKEIESDNCNFLWENVVRIGELRLREELSRRTKEDGSSYTESEIEDIIILMKEEKQSDLFAFASIDENERRYNRIVEKSVQQYRNYDKHIKYKNVPDRVYGISLDDNMKEAYLKSWNALADMGLSEIQIIGVMANIFWESHFCIDNAQDGFFDGDHNKGDYIFRTNDGVGFGLLQWTVHSRKQSLKTMADEMNMSVWELDVQLEYFYSEMENSNYASLWNTFKKTDNLEASVNFFANNIEAPKEDEAHLEERNKIAKEIYAIYEETKYE